MGYVCVWVVCVFGVCVRGRRGVCVRVYIYLNAENRSQAIFLNPFTGCSSCKRKFVVCPFVDDET